MFIHLKLLRVLLKHKLRKSVNTLNTKPKKRRVGRYPGMTKTYKKAVVTLDKDSKIEL